MYISDIFKKKSKSFSFEFFPPKNIMSTVDFGINLGQLKLLSPDFISVTYGAGGSTQSTSFDLIDFIQNKLGLTSMAHYTCVNASKEKIASDLEDLYKINVRNLMLLRGDPPQGQKEFVNTASDIKYASDLVKIAKAQNRFCIGVAGYPENHPESVDTASDIKYLKYKVDQGADFVVTQMFFDNQHYYDFANRAKEAGINLRIIPGIIPITNFKQIQRFSQMCGSVIPPETTDRMEAIQEDKDKMYQLGVDLAIKQCEDLLKNGAPGIHFYTLNKSSATVDIFSSLDKRLFY